MITINLFIYETERKCDTQKRLGARKTTLLPKQRRAVLLPYPPEPLPLGSLRNRDVDFSRIHKLSHYRGKKKIRMERKIWGLFCAEECFGSDWANEIGRSCWSEVTKMRKQRCGGKKQKFCSFLEKEQDTSSPQLRPGRGESRQSFLVHPRTDHRAGSHPRGWRSSQSTPNVGWRMMSRKSFAGGTIKRRKGEL